MLGARLSSAALAAVFFMLGAAAQAAELPPGPNRELVARECQACHNLDAVVASNETRETWNILLDSMTSYGLRVSPEDRAKIVDYLATALGPKPGTAR
jgi:mono/diheme cytochrome c family protein